MDALCLLIVLVGISDPTDNLGPDVFTKLLSNDECEVREFAHSLLVALSRQDLVNRIKSNDPDVQFRLNTIREQINENETLRDPAFNYIPEFKAIRRPLSEKVIDKRYTDFPCFDGLFYDTEKECYNDVSFIGLERHKEPFRRYMEICYSSPSLCPEVPRHYENYRKATREWFVDLHSEGVPLLVIDLLAAEMWRRDTMYLRKAWKNRQSLYTESSNSTHWNRQQEYADRFDVQFVGYNYGGVKPAGYPEWVFFKNFDLPGLLHVVQNFPN